MPGLMEVLAERAMERVDDIVAAYLDALTATSGVTIKMADGSTEFYASPDFAERRKAADAIYDRLLGRPRQALEHSGPDGDPIHVVVPTDIEHAREVAEILAEAGAVSRANGNGNSATNGHH